jgi:predicted acylesterase/phospholipase RssA
MKALRKNVGIAIDGGGIRGLIIATALTTLEEELTKPRRIKPQPLIAHPQIKILAGTSTGAILTSALAMGMTAKEIASVYKEVGQKVFPRLTPACFPRPLKDFVELIFTVTRNSLYSNERLIGVLRKTIGDKTGNPDLTLAGLNKLIGPEKALILTAVNVTERRTHFLKSYDPTDGHWKLWEAILASSSQPGALPVWSRDQAGRKMYYIDGGVGSYGNPAYVAAQEAIAFRKYEASEVSILSFGTGWLSADNFEKEYRPPTTWRGLDWARNAPNLLTADAIRSQSLDILRDPATSTIDFRRFQFELQKSIPGDAYGDRATYDLMEQLGKELGQRIANDHFASAGNYDPEGLYEHLAKYWRASRLS